MPPLDVLEIVIASVPYGIGERPGAEPVVNGVPLSKLVADVEGAAGYGPHDREYLLSELAHALTFGLQPVWTHVLGCICGDYKCSWTQVAMTSNRDGVRWGPIRTSASDCEPIELGPFVFARAQFDAALASPRETDRPLWSYGAED